MDKRIKFTEEINQAFNYKGPSLILGGAIMDGLPFPDTHVKIPLKTLNRHGLIAGATGTGKTKTLQVLAEGLSENGVPVLLMDVKGDLSGIAVEGEINNKINERHEKIGLPFTLKKFPVEFLTLSDEEGVRLRATITEFGPVLFSKILGLNDTQSGLISLIFKYCDDEGLPLLDLKDFKKVLHYISNDGKEEIQKEYGNISTTSTSTILRKVIELEQQGAERFFGEKSFEVEDLIRINKNGEGYISILKIADIQDKPKLFSTFMLCLLAEIYSIFPEEGDLEKPKLVVFIDEAHLIFEEATPALINQLETIVKLVRSKGVGVIFCTQNPSDIPAAILSQLGMKIQHALRAFTAKDRKMIKSTSENYPISTYYKTDELLTSLGIGEAAITVLMENGVPSPLVATLLRAPQTRMGILTKNEVIDIINASLLIPQYNREIDRESAFEMLSAKISLASKDAVNNDDDKKVNKPLKQEKSTLEKVMNSSLARQIGRTVVQQFTRGILGVLGVNSNRRRRS